MSLTTGQDTVEAHECKTERKCEHYNPFLWDESCASTHANGEGLSILVDSPAQFACTNPFVGADCQSHSPEGVYMPPYPAPNVSLKVTMQTQTHFPRLTWKVLYIVHPLLLSQKQAHSPCCVLALIWKRLLNIPNRTIPVIHLYTRAALHPDSLLCWIVMRTATLERESPHSTSWPVRRQYTRERVSAQI